jgi:hypothetical protein
MLRGGSTLSDMYGSGQFICSPVSAQADIGVYVHVNLELKFEFYRSELVSCT